MSGHRVKMRGNDKMMMCEQFFVCLALLCFVFETRFLSLTALNVLELTFVDEVDLKLTDISLSLSLECLE